MLGATLLGNGLLAAPSGAAQSAWPRAFVPEASPANTYTTNTVLTPSCPEAIAGTPGSDPASKKLNNALNTAASFKPGGTVHYIYTDNPHTNDGTQNFTIQDCEVVYPANFFTASDFNADGVLINPAYSKQVLSKNGTQVDGASLSGIYSSVGSIYFGWTSPTDVAPGSWVCNFARDIKNNHGGGGNRKVPPTCYQVPTTPPPPPPFISLTPDISLGYADDLHSTGQMFFPSPWTGPGATYLGCVDGTTGCEAFDAGAILINVPINNGGAIKLTAASVDISTADNSATCHFHPWDNLISNGNPTAAPSGAFILTQTGTLGPPQAAPCDGGVSEPYRPITNFDTSEGPLDVIDRTVTPNIVSINCNPALVSAPVIKLTFVNADGTGVPFTLTVTDNAKILNTGGTDRFGCTGGEEATPWTPVPVGSVVRS